MSGCSSSLYKQNVAADDTFLDEFLFLNWIKAYEFADRYTVTGLPLSAVIKNQFISKYQII